MKKFFINLLLIVFFCSSCYSSYKIYKYISDEKEQKKVNLEMIDGVVKKIEKTENAENREKSSSPLSVDFQALKQKNSDIVAWIYSEDTPINYPVAQSTNNDYYLRRLVDGKYNQAGTIFMDYRNSNDFSDPNTIIYGHNMKDDSMFGTLTNYENQNYYDNHKEMFLYTENMNFKIEIFAGYTTSSEGDIYTYTKTVSTNKKQIDNAIKKSKFSSDVEISSEDKIITLSTCAYTFKDARYVLLGVLRELESQNNE